MDEESSQRVVTADQENELQSLRDKKLLIEFLRDHKERCPVCDYNLKMLTRATCPECGRKLTLSVGVSETYMRPWIVLMVAFASGAGLGLFWCLAILKSGLPPRGIIIPVVGQTLMLPATGLLIKYRRSFFKVQPESQKAIAWIVAIVNIILFVWMVLLVFS